MKCLTPFIFSFVLSLNYFVNGETLITGSFTKDSVKNVNRFAVLLPNGAKRFLFYYFDVPYEIFVNISDDVGELTAYHVCSDLMLTIFLQDGKENIWQCDLPGYIQNLITLDCHFLKDEKRPNCTNRSAKFSLLTAKNHENPETEQASLTTYVLGFIILILLVAIAILIIMLIIKNRKKEVTSSDVEENRDHPTSSNENHDVHDNRDNGEDSRMLERDSTHVAPTSTEQHTVDGSAPEGM